ncbi:hypothetical protein APSETT444_003616 [Aspergillus pseudonomiae]
MASSIQHDVAEDAGLPVISVKDLLNDDRKAAQDLFQACTSLGFFYLDCRDHPSGQLIDQIHEVAETSLRFFDLPQSEKDQWASDCNSYDDEQEYSFMYKPAGRRTGVVEGKKDGWEGILLFEHALSQYRRDVSLPGPASFQNARSLLETTNTYLGDIGRTVLDSLSRSMNLDPSHSLARYHKKDFASPTSLEILKYLPYTPESEKVGHVPHTDMGSLSMVFAEVGGLQVFHPGKNAWTFIEPKPGHAVCNIGDSVEFLSGNTLKSSLHRVVPDPRQKDRIKLSVVYLMRPDTDTVFVDREGREWKSVDWGNMKGKLFLEAGNAAPSSTVLTGRKGHKEFWEDSKMVTAV